jgi:hypothetical protein
MSFFLEWSLELSELRFRFKSLEGSSSDSEEVECKGFFSGEGLRYLVGGSRSEEWEGLGLILPRGSLKGESFLAGMGGGEVN